MEFYTKIFQVTQYSIPVITKKVKKITDFYNWQFIVAWSITVSGRI